MLGRIKASATRSSCFTPAFVWSSCFLLASAVPALAQRPPGPSDPSKSFSLDKTIDWVLARPGFMIGGLVLVAVIIFMIIAQRRPSR